MIKCFEAGLVDGSKIVTDVSLVQADAPNSSVVNQESLGRYLIKTYREMEQRLEEPNNFSLHNKRSIANRKHISTTDPDATPGSFYNSEMEIQRWHKRANGLS